MLPLLRAFGRGHGPVGPLVSAFGGPMAPHSHAASCERPCCEPPGLMPGSNMNAGLDAGPVELSGSGPVARHGFRGHFDTRIIGDAFQTLSVGMRVAGRMHLPTHFS